MIAPASRPTTRAEAEAAEEVAVRRVARAIWRVQGARRVSGGGRPAVRQACQELEDALLVLEHREFLQDLGGRP